MLGFSAAAFVGLAAMTVQDSAPVRLLTPAEAARVDALIAVLGDREANGERLEDTRKAIAELVKLGAPVAPRLIEVVVEADPTNFGNKHGYANLALKNMGRPVVGPVRAAWPKLSEADRWKLMEFRGLHDYATALPFALTSLDSKSDDVLTQAVLFLGTHKERAGRAALVRKLNTAPPRVRWSVIDSLAAIGGDEVVDEFIKLLDKNSWVAKGEGLLPPAGTPPPWWPDGRPRLVAALHTLKAKRAVPTVLALLNERGKGHAYLGAQILPLLADFGGSECLPDLRLIRETPDAELAPSVEGPSLIKRRAEEVIKAITRRID